MEKHQFSIPNISCGHCLKTIENELRELPGVNVLEGDPQNKTITVEWEAPITLETIRDKLNEINYPAA